MRFLALIALASTVIAAPTKDVATREQACGPSFVFARGSTEPSPIVSFFWFFF
jgi:hypothetical protein